MATAFNQMAQEITKNIIDDLQNGVASWIKPWNNSNYSRLPVNGKSLKGYNGVNWLSLLLSADKQGFESNQWFTFKQAKELGANVKKGSKGSKIIFCKQINQLDQETEEETNYTATKVYRVFAREQIEGLPEAAKNDNKNLASIEVFIKASQAEIKHSGDKAFFDPARNFIQVPEISYFKGSQDYYATVMHELIHWTAHKSRLDRDCSNYAFEELVAELGAAFLCSHLGIEGNLQHSEYIGSWIKALSNDYKYITRAASQAQKAANYLIEANANA